MNRQMSFSDEEGGTVYAVPTPIGNLEDITLRALKTLSAVSVIAAEDTRNTKKLLQHFDIHTPLISYHEHNKENRGEELLERLAQGESIAIVSDAGMPVISDPGYEIITSAISSGFSAVALPGANAALCALVGSGMSSGKFLFYGFLPRKEKEKKAELERLKSLPATILLYESPFRIKDTLKTIRTCLGNRHITLARELTKKFEEYGRGTVDELIDWTEETEIKGEISLVIEGNTADDTEQNTLWWSYLSVIGHVSYYIEEFGFSSKEAIKQTAADRKMSKRDVYQAYHVE